MSYNADNQRFYLHFSSNKTAVFPFDNVRLAVFYTHCVFAVLIGNNFEGWIKIGFLEPRFKISFSLNCKIFQSHFLLHLFHYCQTIRQPNASNKLYSNIPSLYQFCIFQKEHQSHHLYKNIE